MNLTLSGGHSVPTRSPIVIVHCNEISLQNNLKIIEIRDSSTCRYILIDVWAYELTLWSNSLK